MPATADEDGKGKKQRESRSQLPNTLNQECRVEIIFKFAHHVFRFTHWQEMMAFPASSFQQVAYLSGDETLEYVE